MTIPKDPKYAESVERQKSRTSFIQFVLCHLPRERRNIKVLAARLSVMTGRRHGVTAVSIWCRRPYACPKISEWEKWCKALGLQEREWLKLFIKWLKAYKLFDKEKYVRRPDAPHLQKRQFRRAKNHGFSE